jgi:hypothetical protein
MSEVLFPTNMLFESVMKVVADSPDRIRSCDVDRMLSEAHMCFDEELVEDFIQWLYQQELRENTRQAIEDWQPEENM